MAKRDHSASGPSGVDWNKNVHDYEREVDTAKEILDSTAKVALWSHQLESADSGNPALVFVRSMQISMQHANVLTALALYRPVASALRCMAESALYYTYFRAHPLEFATLSRDSTYFVQKNDVVDFHKRHTELFPQLFDKTGLCTKLNKWYGDVSSIVHGQNPGAWVSSTSIKNTFKNVCVLGQVRCLFVETVEVIHLVFICTVARELWPGFSHPAKAKLLKGMSGELRLLSGLERA